MSECIKCGVVRNVGKHNITMNAIGLISQGGTFKQPMMFYNTICNSLKCSGNISICDDCIDKDNLNGYLCKCCERTKKINKLLKIKMW